MEISTGHSDLPVLKASNALPSLWVPLQRVAWVNQKSLERILGRLLTRQHRKDGGVRGMDETSRVLVNASDAAAARPAMSSAALESFIARNGIAILATARRFSSNVDDADDVYQATVEVLFTRAPTEDEDQLLAWSRKVAKNFALSQWRSNARRSNGTLELTAVDPADDVDLESTIVDDERDAQVLQALRRLRPEHARCLLLRADDRSYPEICAVTGYSYAKVNRYLSEGRKALQQSFERIDGNSECERLSGALSMFADGECDETRASDVRLHLGNCLACQSTLREYRAAPRRVAAVFPIAAIEAADPSLVDRVLVPFRRIGDAVQSAANSLHELIAGRAVAFQQLTEVSAAKQAAVAVGVSASLVTAGAGVGIVASGGAANSERERAETPNVPAQTEPTAEVGKPDESTSSTPSKTQEPSRDAKPSDVESRDVGEQVEEPAPVQQPPVEQSAPAGDEFNAPSGSGGSETSGTSESAPDLAP